MRYGFLCRPVYSKASQIIANVGRVKAGNRLHIAFSWEDAHGTNLDGIGSFEVLDAPDLNLGGPVAHEKYGSLPIFTFRRDSDLHKVLERANYKQDPKLGAYTGWHV